MPAGVARQCGAGLGPLQEAQSRMLACWLAGCVGDQLGVQLWQADPAQGQLQGSRWAG